MKRMNGLVLFCLMLSLFVSLWIAPTVFSRDTVFEAKGKIAIDITSSFFTLNYKFINGFAQFGVNGPNIQHNATIASLGRVIGGLDITSTSLKQFVTMLDGGTLSSLSSVQNNEIVVLKFNGVGFVKEVINTDELNKGSTHLYVLLNAKYVWIYVKDNRPKRPGPRPCLKVLAVGVSGNRIRMVVKNFGNASASGNTILRAKLSYKARYWIGDSDICLFTINFGCTKIKPGQTVNYDFVIPNKLPKKPIELFLERRGLFDSFDYPDPAQDCFDFCLSVGGKTVDGFSPIHIHD